MDLADLQVLNGKIERLLAHHNALRRGLGMRGGRDQGACTTSSPPLRPRCCRSWTRCGRCSTRSAARASASCSRARRARCSTSTTAPILTSPRRTRWRRRPRPARGSGPNAIGYVLGICKAYTTRVGAGAVSDRAAQRDRQDARTKGKEFGVVTGRPRRCGWFDAVLVRQTVQNQRYPGHRADQARHPRRLSTEIKICTATGSTAARSTICRPASTPRPGSSRSTRPPRAGTGITAKARSWAELAGAGDQIRAPDRGIDRLSGGIVVDQPRAGRHNSDAEPLRDLTKLKV